MTEQSLQKKIAKFLKKEYGAYVTVNVITGSAGTPDILACICGKFIGIEVKLPGKLNTVSALQTKHMQWIKEAGGIAFVATSIEEVRKHLFINRITETDYKPNLIEV